MIKKTGKIEKVNLDTGNKNTWCPGCPNFSVLAAFKKTVCEMINEGAKKEEFVIVTDIGCNGKIYDYIDVSGFNTLHGRILPTAFGIKAGNPKLKVVCFSGDGGSYDEGLNHLIHSCRDNTNMTLIVHNNQVFSLTAGQATSATEKGFVEKTHPFGLKEKPLNPIVLALEAGATFVARVSALDCEEMSRVMKQAILHKGFSFVEILQPCLIYHNTTSFLKSSCYKINEMPFEQAVFEARKWNYAPAGKVAVGIFYRKQEPSFEEKYLSWKL